MTTNRFCEITHELQHLSKLSEQCARIDPALYAKYDVKRGLRDINGKGVFQMCVSYCASVLRRSSFKSWA